MGSDNIFLIIGLKITMLGRNAKCLCGSGKKYKKCCLNAKDVPIQKGKDYFHSKGKNAEEFVHQLAHRTFMRDWCYLNPYFLDSKKQKKEICDLLILFEKTLIIWQVKSLKLKDGKYKERKVEKNLKQLLGAKRLLLEGKKDVVTVDSYGNKIEFHKNNIQHIYLISSLIGEKEAHYCPLEIYENNNIHVFNFEATCIVMSELNTITDFVNYLGEKEKILHTKTSIFAESEKDVLAFYLINNRSFSSLCQASFVVFDRGQWDKLKSKPEYQKKKKEDENSYWWDGLIERTHYCGREYKTIAQEMARFTRFERRCLGKYFIDALNKAKKQIKEHNNFGYETFRRVLFCDKLGVSFSFIFTSRSMDRNERKSFLIYYCQIVKKKFDWNKKIIGIATEVPEPINFEFVLYDTPFLTPEEEHEIDKIDKEYRMLESPDVKYMQEKEYSID